MYKNNSSGNVLYYEQTFNLLYISKNYYPSNKGSLLKKERNNDSAFSNLFIWDIKAKQKSMVFPNEVAASEQIQKIIFEEYYDEKEQRVVFNRETQLLNNKGIPFRHSKNLILIETYHKSSEKHLLWTCDKQGKGLQKIASLTAGTQWHLDVGNSTIRILKHSSKDVEIEEIPW